MIRRALEYVVIVAVAVAVALAVQAYLVKPYFVPTPSMAATLRPGDRVLVDRVSYRVHAPRRGDIVVFHAPGDGAVTLVKRLVGLPGETLQVRGGSLYVDGRRLSEPYVHRTGGRPDATTPGEPVDGGTMRRPWSLLKPYTVPADSYFVMGDNRAESSDSREWGVVPRDRLIGAARVVYWPPGRWTAL